MPAVYRGQFQHNEKAYMVKAIFSKDIKINLYKKSDKTDFSKILKSGGATVGGLMEKASYELESSFVSLVVNDTKNKRFKRENYIFGDIVYANKIQELFNQSYLPGEETSHETYPSHKGVVTESSYKKGLTSGDIISNIKVINGVIDEIDVTQTHVQDQFHLSLVRTNKNSRVAPTEGVDYYCNKFDVGDVRETAIHSQVRSLQHLRSIKNLDWIDKLIETGDFRIIDKLEDLKVEVDKILSDLQRTGEVKVYYDTEGTGLNVIDLPPDHPKLDMLAAHILSWVSERRADGYPLKIQTIVVPVGMRYCDNIDEIDAIEVLEKVIANPNIGVVSHNSDYEVRINLRYSEIEGKLSYRKYYKWLKQMQAESLHIDREYVQSQIQALEKELEEVSKTVTGIAGRLKVAPIRNKITELQRKLNIDKEIERVKNLPSKYEKPYMSDIKGEKIFRVNVKYDTLVLSRMANNGALMKDGETPFKRHALEVLTKEFVGVDQLSLDDIYGNSQSSSYKIYDFSLLPREFLLYYACPDTYLLPIVEWHLERQVYNHLKYLGIEENTAITANIELLNLYYKVDTPFAIHMAEFANYKGIAIDKEKLEADRYRQEEAAELIVGLLEELTGEEGIKWSSVGQVAPIIFYKYRYPVKYRTEKGQDSYNKRTRKLHMKQKKDDFDVEYEDVVDIPEMKEDLVDSEGNVIIKKDVVNNLKCPLSYIYQEYMDRFKDLTSFTKMIEERTHYVDGEWIYFPSYTSTSTDTGRAAGGTMIMKASKKSTFKARDGFVLLGGDLDQAELRLIATMSQDLADIQDFKNPRYDPHRKTGSQISGVPQSEVTKESRDAAKVINFGYFYGMQDRSCAENIYKDFVPVPEPLVLKVKIMLKDFARSNRVKVNWLNNIRESVKKLGFSKTPMGRYKFFPEIKKEDIEPWELARVGRQGGNVPIQGLCADFIKDRLVKVFDVIKECNISRFFTQPLFIHDEFHAEVAKEAFVNASNEIYTKERVRYEQQFNLFWLYELIYHTFTEKPLGFSYLQDEAPMTLGIGLGENWEQSKSDLHGLPQELQRVVVNEYRNEVLPDEFYNAVRQNPIDALLHRIRTWWAEQVVYEIEKVGSIDAIPRDIVDKMDLFIKGNIKDVFPVKISELKDLGVIDFDPSNMDLDTLENKVGKGVLTLGQIAKAIKYLKGDDVALFDVLDSDKIDLQEDEELVSNYIENEIIDLEYFRKMKQKVDITAVDYEDYDYVFKESKLLEFGKIMIHENNKILELNIDGLTYETVKDLEKLISNNHSEVNNYSVVIVAQRPDDVTPYKVIKTTYRVNPNENLLLKIKAVYSKDRERELEFYKNLA